MVDSNVIDWICFKHSAIYLDWHDVFYIIISWWWQGRKPNTDCKLSMASIFLIWFILYCTNIVYFSLRINENLYVICLDIDYLIFSVDRNIFIYLDVFFLYNEIKLIHIVNKGNSNQQERNKYQLRFRIMNFHTLEICKFVEINVLNVKTKWV